MNGIGRVRLDPIVFVVRGYPKKVDTECLLKDIKEPYSCSGTVTITNRVAFAQGFTGEIDRVSFKNLLDKLREAGAEELVWERRLTAGGKSVSYNLLK